MPYIHKYAGRDYIIPDHMVATIRAYADEGQPVGDFLRAVFSNDLQGAVGHADDKNFDNLRVYCAYVHFEIPSTCHGSREAYQTWIKQHEAGRKVEPEEEPC